MRGGKSEQNGNQDIGELPLHDKLVKAYCLEFRKFHMRVAPYAPANNIPVYPLTVRVSKPLFVAAAAAAA